MPSGRRLERLAAFAVVAALHGVGLWLFLGERSVVRPAPPPVFAALILQERRVPPPPPPPPAPAMSAVAMRVPVPDFTVAEAVAAAPAPSPVKRQALPARTRSAGDASSLDMDVATTSGGGEADRRALVAFTAAVKAAVLIHKVQPKIARALRNSCLINYTITIDKAGRMLSYTIDPCTVAQLNDAARRAIAAAGPFPPPPAFSGARTDIHGSLVFEP